MAPATSTTSVAATGRVVPYSITTTWTAPTQCVQSVGGLTMLEIDQYRIWLNAILPVPGTTVTSCYPTQYASSFLLQTGGISQPAMSPLVCPAGYTTQGPFTSNYIACCPSGWGGIALASNAPSDRPAFGGTCYSDIYNVPLSISFYDNSELKATSIFTATDISAQAFASPYEGFALGVAVVQSTTGTGSTIPSATDSSAAPSTIPSSSSSHLSSGATAGIVVGIVVGLILTGLAAFFILKHRRGQLERSRSGDDNDLNTPEHNLEPKNDDSLTLAEVYGSQEVKNHGEVQELGAPNRVHEVGEGHRYEMDAGRSSMEKGGSLHDLPSPDSQSPRSPAPPYR